MTQNEWKHQTFSFLKWNQWQICSRSLHEGLTLFYLSVNVLFSTIILSNYSPTPDNHHEDGRQQWIVGNNKKWHMHRFFFCVFFKGVNRAACERAWGCVDVRNVHLNDINTLQKNPAKGHKANTHVKRKTSICSADSAATSASSSQPSSVLHTSTTLRSALCRHLNKTCWILGVRRGYSGILLHPHNSTGADIKSYTACLKATSSVLYGENPTVR